MYNRLGTVPACDGQTGRRTDILPRHSPRYAYAYRGKKNPTFWAYSPTLWRLHFIYTVWKIYEDHSCIQLCWLFLPENVYSEMASVRREVCTRLPVCVLVCVTSAVARWRRCFHAHTRQ